MSRGSDVLGTVWKVAVASFEAACLFLFAPAQAADLVVDLSVPGSGLLVSTTFKQVQVGSLPSVWVEGEHGDTWKLGLEVEDLEPGRVDAHISVWSGARRNRLKLEGEKWVFDTICDRFRIKRGRIRMDDGLPPDWSVAITLMEEGLDACEGPASTDPQSTDDGA